MMWLKMKAAKSRVFLVIFISQEPLSFDPRSRLSLFSVGGFSDHSLTPHKIGFVEQRVS